MGCSGDVLLKMGSWRLASGTKFKFAFCFLLFAFAFVLACVCGGKALFCAHLAKPQIKLAVTRKEAF